jgi:transaldolase
MTSDVVFLLDVDNTLLDNDRIIFDLRQHLEREFGVASSDRYWAAFEALRSESGYADYLGALQRWRRDAGRNGEDLQRLLQVSGFLLDYPFAERLYPGALEVVARLGRFGPTVILSDGDAVFQPRKVQRSGLWDAVAGRVLIYIHKERVLADVQRLYPARRYVIVDDKLRVLAAMKDVLGERLTTVFPRQGHYALDAVEIARYPAADLTIERIGDLADADIHPLLAVPIGTSSDPGKTMNANTRRLHELGQSLWLDNITRTMLADGTLARYIAELSVTGLTSNPTIFEHAIGSGSAYDASIAGLARDGHSGEEIFFALALQDLTRAADLFRPIHEATGGVDGWVSLEVSPLLADDTRGTIQAAARLHAAAARPNLFIKIPGTPAGIAAIEESIFAGVPVNVTLLFSREHYLDAAGAYLRGIERRIAAGLDPKVESVASIFVSRWDVAVKEEISPPFHNRLGIAIAMRTYKAYRDLLASSRWRELAQAGARPQRLLWASTGTKDPAAADTLYVEALAAPDTVDTLPEKTLLAFADHGRVGAALPVGGGYAEAVLEEFRREGVDDDALAARLQREGAEAFSTSWHALLASIREKCAS